MTFRHLPQAFHAMADAVVTYLETERGITGFVEEDSIHKDLSRPSLHAKTADHHFLCLEFSETSPFPLSVERFAPECSRLCLPVRVFVAVPSNSKDENFSRDLKRARDWGIGVLAVSADDVTPVQEALSLSLAGVRRIDMKIFPAKYRYALSQAEATFRQGNPAKGCSDIYDEIEALTRRIAKKTKKAGMWKASKVAGGVLPGTNLEKGQWANVMEVLMNQLEPGHPPHIPKAQLAHILGVTPHRNDTGHKPGSNTALIKRDTSLRTRFENAVDMLFDLITVSKSLRV
jgi:hypothetical protein